MGIDIRYHIISLIAVFLALGIGILVGSTLVPRSLILERLVDKQRVIVARLEKDFEEIQKESRRIKYELEKSYQFQEEILPIVIRNKLPGMKLAIIETTPLISSSARNSLISMLEQAKAEVLSTTIITHSFSLDEENIRQEVVNYLGIGNSLTDDKNEIVTLLIKEVAEGIINPQKSQTLHYLHDKELLQISGSYTLIPDYIIIIGGAQDTNKARHIDIPLIRKLLEAGIKVIGCEPKDVKISYIRHYKKEGIPTIDNIDTIPGQITLVYVLQGYEGNFGIKPTATQLLPRVLE